jgi:hypothetical protein
MNWESVKALRDYLLRSKPSPHDGVQIAAQLRELTKTDLKSASPLKTDKHPHAEGR